MCGQPFQVLDGGGQEELILGAGQAPQSESNHRENRLGLAKQRLDLLAFSAGVHVSLGLYQSAGVVTGILVYIARDLAGRRGRTTSTG